MRVFVGGNESVQRSNGEYRMHTKKSIIMDVLFSLCSASEEVSLFADGRQDTEKNTGASAGLMR